jgi:catechol 2,3-dioxygenase-like lactoylglutathione lyase family enzyme
MQKLSRAFTLLVLLGGVAVSPAAAQIAAPNDAGVALGHLHYVVRDVEANTAFWVALGGEAARVAETVVVTFPDVLVLLDEGESSGGTEGSILNHAAFRVQSLETVAAAGLELERLGSFSAIGNVFSPEGERIELFDDTATNLTFTRDDGGADPVTGRHNRLLDGPIRSHHLHLYLVEDAVEEAQRWYATTFGGVPGMRWRYDAVDLPGINFNFSYNPDAGGAPTAGRMLDHIGFEVANLERFCRGLEARGITFDMPYRRSPEGVGYAFLTDPWGVRIALTEGLRGR